MSVKATAVIKKEAKVDPKKPNDKGYYASLALLSEGGKEYGLPRYFSGFHEVGELLRREAGIPHEQLQDRYLGYEKGEDVRISLTLENDEVIRSLGFDPKAA
jgi:hypothetical protein